MDVEEEWTSEFVQEHEDRKEARDKRDKDLKDLFMKALDERDHELRKNQEDAHDEIDLVDLDFPEGFQAIKEFVPCKKHPLMPDWNKINDSLKGYSLDELLRL